MASNNFRKLFHGEETEEETIYRCETIIGAINGEVTINQPDRLTIIIDNPQQLREIIKDYPDKPIQVINRKRSKKIKKTDSSIETDSSVENGKNNLGFVRDSGETVDREEILKALDDHDTETSAELLNVREYRSDSQQWKYNGGTLENLAGIWASTANWELPSEGSTGKIKNVDRNMVLGKVLVEPTLVLGVEHNAMVTGTKVIMEEMVKNSAGQLWKIGDANSSGYFNITNPSSGKVLTAVATDKLTIEDLSNDDGTNHISFDLKIVKSKFKGPILRMNKVVILIIMFLSLATAVFILFFVYVLKREG